MKGDVIGVEVGVGVEKETEIIETEIAGIIGIGIEKGIEIDTGIEIQTEIIERGGAPMKVMKDQTEIVELATHNFPENPPRRS